MRLFVTCLGAPRLFLRFFAAGLTGVLLPGLTFAADSEKAAKPVPGWQVGPGVASLKTAAEVKLPKGYRFANAEDTQRMLKSAGEPVSGAEMGMIVPEEGAWSVFFEFSEDGYVKDDDKDKLDADKLLKSIIQGNDQANRLREKQGRPPLNIIGWEKPPFYDATTHNLEWAIRAESQGRPILNYNTRLLGRRGVMEVVLVCNPDKLSETLPPFKDLLAGYSYKGGESYAEYRPGDKLAKYGLTALVAGGAVAVAAKTGLLATAILFLKKGWKLVVVLAVAVVSLVKRVLFGRSEPRSTE